MSIIKGEHQAGCGWCGSMLHDTDRCEKRPVQMVAQKGPDEDGMLWMEKTATRNFCVFVGQKTGTISLAICDLETKHVVSVSLHNLGEVLRKTRMEFPEWFEKAEVVL